MVKTFRCCECDRPVVTRMVDKCLYCEAELNEEIKLSKEEKARLGKLEMQKLHAEREARIERDKEHIERKKKQSDDLGGSDYDVFGPLGMFGFMGFLD